MQGASHLGRSFPTTPPQKHTLWASAYMARRAHRMDGRDRPTSLPPHSANRFPFSEILEGNPGARSCHKRPGPTLDWELRRSLHNPGPLTGNTLKTSFWSGLWFYRPWDRWAGSWILILSWTNWTSLYGLLQRFTVFWLFLVAFASGLLL